MKKIILFFIFILNLNCNNIYGQNAQKFGTMTEQEKKDFVRRAQDMFNDFKFALKIIPRFNNNKLKKDKIIRNTLKSFVIGSEIEIALDKGKYKTYKIANYLKNKLTNYGENNNKLVEIEVIDFTINDTLKKHPTIPNAYSLKYSFTQKFSASRPSNLKDKEGLVKYEDYYIDLTKKTGEIIIVKENNILGTKWITKMGDVKVESFKRIK